MMLYLVARHTTLYKVWQKNNENLKTSRALESPIIKLFILLCWYLCSLSMVKLPAVLSIDFICDCH